MKGFENSARMKAESEITKTKNVPVMTRILPKMTQNHDTFCNTPYTA